MQVFSQNDTGKKNMILVYDKKLAWLYHKAVFIYKLVDVNAPEKFLVFKVNGENGRKIFILVHSFSDGVKHLDRVQPAVRFLELEVHHSVCGIGIRSYKLCLNNCVIRWYFVLS